MSRPADHSPRFILAVGALATVAALLMSTASHAADRPACPRSTAPTFGIAPLDFCSGPLDRRVAGVADPEPRGRSHALLSIVTRRAKDGSTRTTIRYAK